jgi:hypothetical protein
MVLESKFKTKTGRISSLRSKTMNLREKVELLFCEILGKTIEKEAPDWFHLQVNKILNYRFVVEPDEVEIEMVLNEIEDIFLKQLGPIFNQLNFEGKSRFLSDVLKLGKLLRLPPQQKAPTKLLKAAIDSIKAEIHLWNCRIKDPQLNYLVCSPASVRVAELRREVLIQQLGKLEGEYETRKGGRQPNEAMRAFIYAFMDLETKYGFFGIEKKGHRIKVFRTSNVKSENKRTDGFYNFTIVKLAMNLAHLFHFGVSESNLLSHLEKYGEERETLFYNTGIETPLLDRKAPKNKREALAMAKKALKESRKVFP